MAKIALIDDSLETLAMMARVIMLMEHDAMTFSSGAAALEALQNPQSSPADIILLDYMMPEMNGLEVLEQLQRNPRTRGIPVILFTAVNSDQLRELAMAVGARDFWLKASMGLDEMQQRINDLLDKSGKRLSSSDISSHSDFDIPNSQTD